MRIDNKVFERHGFKLGDYYEHCACKGSIKAWRRDGFPIEFVNPRNNGCFDENGIGCGHIELSVKPFFLIGVLNAAEETLDMIRETWAIEDAEREERFRKSHAGTESDDLPADDGKGESK